MSDDLEIRVRTKGAREAATDLDKVTASEKRVGAEGERAGKRARRGARDLSLHERATKRAAKGTGALVKRTLALGAAYVGLSKGKQAIDTTVELAKSTLSLQSAFGASEQSAAEWAAIGKSRNIDNKALNQGFVTLAKNVLAAADGGDKQAAAFRRLGIHQDELRRGTHDLDFLLGRTADGFQRMGEDPKRAAVMAQLLGRGWQTLRPILAGGSAEIAKQKGIVDKHGLSLKSLSQGELKELIDSQREAKIATLGLQVAFGTAMAPVLTDVTNAGTALIKVFRDPHLTPDEKFAKFQKVVGPLGDQLEQGIHDFGPKIADAAADIAPDVAGAFWGAWKDAGTGGKIISAAWLMHKLGGGSVLRGVGEKAGEKAAGGIASGVGSLSKRSAKGIRSFARWLLRRSAVTGAAAGAAEGAAHSSAATGAGLIGRSKRGMSRYRRWLVVTSTATGAASGRAAGAAMAGGQGLTGAATKGKLRGAGTKTGKWFGRAFAAGAVLAIPDLVSEFETALHKKWPDTFSDEKDPSFWSLDPLKGLNPLRGEFWDVTPDKKVSPGMRRRRGGGGHKKGGAPPRRRIQAGAVDRQPMSVPQPFPLAAEAPKPSDLVIENAQIYVGDGAMTQIATGVGRVVRKSRDRR